MRCHKQDYGRVICFSAELLEFEPRSRQLMRGRRSKISSNDRPYLLTSKRKSRCTGKSATSSNFLMIRIFLLVAALGASEAASIQLPMESVAPRRWPVRGTNVTSQQGLVDAIEPFMTIHLDSDVELVAYVTVKTWPTGIVIEKVDGLTIHGAHHSIDGNFVMRCFLLILSEVSFQAVTIKNGFVSGNGGKRGGNGVGAGIYSDSSRVVMHSSNFINNNADNQGGGVYIDGGSMELTRCTFKNNQAYAGFGMFIEGGRPGGASVGLNGCTLHENSGYGGTIYVSRGGHVDMRACDFALNEGTKGSDLFVYTSGKFAVRSGCPEGSYNPGTGTALDCRLASGGKCRDAAQLPANLTGGCFACAPRTYACCGSVACAAARSRHCVDPTVRAQGDFRPCFHFQGHLHQEPHQSSGYRGASARNSTAASKPKREPFTVRPTMHRDQISWKPPGHS